MNLQDLQPNKLWSFFSQINSIPRASKKEERIRKFMLSFGQNLGLETLEDEIGNVIIKKPASNGMENRQTVVLQSHLDMVHQKNSDTKFDFDTQGIEMFVDGDWLKAKGTTLGADNGIGVAAIMAILESKDIEHPAIEALFTIDEETGMTGAIQLNPKNISGTILLNLDTEDDDELSIGCAGGIDTNTNYNYKEVSVENPNTIFEIKISGLLGGHSGMDIHTGRANANKLMTRILFELHSKQKIQLLKFDGGSLRNAIPREAVVVISVENASIFESQIKEITNEILIENQTIEKFLKIEFTSTNSSDKAVDNKDLIKILNTLHAVQNGVFRMSPDIKDLVEASSSLARVIIENGSFKTQSLQRSSVESSKKDIANTIKTTFELMECEVVQGGEYPGWKPNPESKILKVAADIYRKKFQEEPKIKACHAGLECGILGGHFPEMDMISFGPNIRAAHSPDEKVQISSVQKFWSYFLEILKETPLK